MSLFDADGTSPDPAPRASSSGRWIAILVIVTAVAAGVYFYRSDDVPETGARVDPAPVAPAASVERPAPVEPVPEPEVEPVEETITPRPIIPAAPPPAPVRLRVRSDVDGADVFIDRQFVGKTPFESTDVGTGRHRVNVSAPGFDGFGQDVEIGDRLTELDVTFTVVRLDERVAVIHDHRFGDCSGHLVADVSGIRYETTDDDAFSVALEDLEEFAVDYVEHNLVVKVRGGREYNFTDTEENADLLFVFHREVDEARQRLSDAQ